MHVRGEQGEAADALDTRITELADELKALPKED
jgi:hypothetical protein